MFSPHIAALNKLLCTLTYVVPLCHVMCVSFVNEVVSLKLLTKWGQKSL